MNVVTEIRLARPKALSLIADNIPAELKELKQWVVWRYMLTKKGKWTKVPFVPRMSYRAFASVDDASTWSVFGAALTVYELANHYDGIGFVISDHDPYMGVDLDHCIVDGQVETWAQTIIDRLPGYWELSASGTGLRHFRRGRLPGDGRRNGGRRTRGVEMYDRRRFLSVTGHILKGYGHE